MLPKKPRQFFKKHHIVCSLSAALLIFFCNFTGFSAASPFEIAETPKEKTKHRLPSSVAQPILKFDCSHPSEKLAVSTSFETIRLEAQNCPQKIGFKNEKHPQSLVIFPMGHEKYSSEFAYLKQGENTFNVSLSDKNYKVSVTRFSLTAPH